MRDKNQTFKPETDKIVLHKWTKIKLVNLVVSSCILNSVWALDSQEYKRRVNILSPLYSKRDTPATILRSHNYYLAGFPHNSKSRYYLLKVYVA